MYPQNELRLITGILILMHRELKNAVRSTASSTLGVRAINSLRTRSSLENLIGWPSKAWISLPRRQ